MLTKQKLPQKLVYPCIFRGHGTLETGLSVHSVSFSYVVFPFFNETSELSGPGDIASLSDIAEKRFRTDLKDATPLEFFIFLS